MGSIKNTTEEVTETDDKRKSREASGRETEGHWSVPLHRHGSEVQAGSPGLVLAISVTSRSISMGRKLPHLSLNLPSKKADGMPRKYFDYLPVIPRLRALLANSVCAQYRANHAHEPGIIKDAFDGSHYQSLLTTIVPGDADPYFYFSNKSDIQEVR